MDEQILKLLNKSFLLASVLVVGVLLFFIGQLVYESKVIDLQNNYQITVSGEGKIYAKPDVALVNLGVATEGSTTADVIDRNTKKMNAVIQAVKDAGVDEKDIKSTTYNLSPLYNWTEAAGRVFQGYTLQQNIQVKIRDFTKIGEILNKATSSGANLANDLQFTIDDPEQFREQARTEAINQAKEKAKNLAKESGIKLGKIINVYENYNSYPVSYDLLKGYGGAATESAPVPTIESGQQEVTITINLTYQIR